MLNNENNYGNGNGNNGRKNSISKSSKKGSKNIQTTFVLDKYIMNAFSKPMNL